MSGEKAFFIFWTTVFWVLGAIMALEAIGIADNELMLRFACAMEAVIMFLIGYGCYRRLKGNW